jgi:processive 1,2-diacylglycerol beta-glucosyltransferase
MKILIFYASYGGGHLNAAKSINDYIISNYPNNDVELIDCMKYVNKTIEKLTTAAYREMAKKAPWAWGKIYSDSQKGPLAHLSSRSNKIMAIKLLRLLREKQPDVIISTHPFGSQMCSYLKRKNKITAKIATIMTDFSPHDQWLVGHKFTDYFFVANDKMKNYLISKGITENKISVTGIPISNRFLKTYNKKKILDTYNLSEDKFTVLFFGGGEFGLGKTKTAEIFESFVQESLKEKIQIIAIAGKNPKMKASFEEIVSKYSVNTTTTNTTNTTNTTDITNNVKILEFTNQVPELMSISDLVVTKPGGLTTSESLASHLPMLIINPIPGQEEENAEFLEDKGIAIWLRKNDDSKLIIENLLADNQKLNLMKENTKLLARPHSTETICKMILGTEQKII